MFKSWIKKGLAICAAGLIGLSTVGGSLTAQAADFSVAASSAIAIDATSGKIFYEQNSQEVRGIASLTKMITLYLTLEAVKDNKISWDDSVTISDYAAEMSQDMELSNVPLYKENQYTVKELFDASAIFSANAAAVSLAEKIAGSESKFVDMMKEKLTSWGIKDAKLVNATGLNNSYLGDHRYPGSASDAENMMSAQDVAVIARHLITDYPEILKVSSTPTQSFGEGTYAPVEMINWNWMLKGFDFYKEGVDGLKTGTTELAGACFAGTMIKDDWRIITVVLDATDHTNNAGARFIETGKLMDYVYANWQTKTLHKQGEQLQDAKSIAVKDGKELSVGLVLDKDLTYWEGPSQGEPQVEVTATKEVSNKQLTAPVKKNTAVYDVTVKTEKDLGYIAGANPETAHLNTAQDVEKANFFVLTGRAIKNFFTNLF